MQRVISLGLSARQTGEAQGPPAARGTGRVAGFGRRQPRSRALPRSDPRRIEREGGAASHDTATAAHAVREAEQEDGCSKLGPKLKEAEAALAKLSASELDASPLVVAGVELAPMDIVREFTAQPGWVGIADKGTQVAINTTITEELKLEGLARVVIRQVQDTRKNAGLDLLDKIALHLQPGSDELAKAIAAHSKPSRPQYRRLNGAKRRYS